MSERAPGRRHRPPDGPEPEPLDPATSPGRWERTVDAVVRAAAPELRRRARSPGVAGLIGRWARPVTAAAAALILAASTALLWPGTDTPAGRPGASAGAAPSATAAADGGTPDRGRAAGDAVSGLQTAVYPEPVGAWMGDGGDPTVEEIVFSASVEQNRP